MPGGEGVLEVEDGEDEAEELPERHHQRDRQRGALGGQDEDAADAHVSGSRRSRLGTGREVLESTETLTLLTDLLLLCKTLGKVCRILGDGVGQQVEPHDGHRQAQHRNEGWS